MQKTELESFCPASRQEWRQWLKENHGSKQAVWLVYYKKKSGMPTISCRMRKFFLPEGICRRFAPDEEKFIGLHTCGFLVSTENDVI